MKNYHNKIYLLETISAFIGLFYIVYLLWLRLILVRLPRNLDNNYTSLQIISFSLLFVISLFIFILYIKRIYNIPSGKLTIRILTSNSYLAFNRYILEAPKNLYQRMLQYIVIRSFIEKIGATLWNKGPYTYCRKIIILLLSIRIFVSLVFILDVFYFKILYYFYYSLALILLALIFNANLYILKDFSVMNQKHIENEFLIIEVNEERNGFYADLRDKYKDTMTDEQLNNLSASWVTYLANDMFVTKCYEYQELYSKYVFLFCYALYTIGWFFILYSYFMI